MLQLVADLGFEAVDDGELNVARLLPLTMLWIRLAIGQGLGREIALRPAAT